MPFDSLGRILLVLGVVIAGLGLLLVFGGRIPFLGQLPGDLQFGRDGFRVYLPIATSIVLSIVVTIVLNLAFRLLNRP